MLHPENFDVIIVGGGHAGTEAALASSRLGAKTLLLTHSVDTLGQMSCNPAIGGIGKGHLVKEIDALGGVMARAIDVAGIQFRKLNARKGPAVRATRAQADRVLYRQAIRSVLENQENLHIFQQAVDDLVVSGDRVTGVVTQMGLKFSAKAVVLTVGTFLGGRIHIGMSQHSGGRAGDPPSIALANRLRDLPFRVDRLKTGTPPRIDARSINFQGLAEQPGDTPVPVFSFMGDPAEHPRQVSCFITHTNENTHDIIRGSLDRSPMFTGVIEGTGPRYCPSIEDKVVRFADKISHQIFIEPEGLNTHEVYPNGISTSLPFDVQYKFVQSMKGFENAHITRPGYAIEYDFFDPRDLYPSLETKHIQALFFAGQINGTTGYEEAAAQGLIAGLNAALKIQDREPWSPRRNEAYIGVLIDDLITQGTQEPYRMFTSRAEYRLMLREDNADLRLTPAGRELGLIDDARWAVFNEKQNAITREQQRLHSTWLRPGSNYGHKNNGHKNNGHKNDGHKNDGHENDDQNNDDHKKENQKIESVLGSPLSREARLSDLLKRPGITYHALMSLVDQVPAEMPDDVIEQVEIQAKYEGYISRQQTEIDRQRRNEEVKLPGNIDYQRVKGLSNEVRQKLEQHRPVTVGQASRISGITPAAISLLLIHLKKRAG